MARQDTLNSIFEAVTNHLKHSTYTIVLDSQRGSTGRIYSISIATHEQAAKHCAQRTLISGNTTEIAHYLAGYRDLLENFSPYFITK